MLNVTPLEHHTFAHRHQDRSTTRSHAMRHALARLFDGRSRGVAHNPGIVGRHGSRTQRDLGAVERAEEWSCGLVIGCGA